MPHRVLWIGMVLAVALLGLQDRARGAETPRVVRENIEWLDVWLPDSNASGLPRVLLIGDSITRGYYPEVQKRLEGKAYAARLATSKSIGDPALLSEVAAILGESSFDVIHFNNGLHGFGYTEDEYRRDFPRLLALLKKHAPHAKLIWATTTPVRIGPAMTEFGPQTERIRERNKIAAEFISKQGLPVDDLFALVENHPEFYLGSDGTHFAPKGVSAEAEQVAVRILEAIAGK